MKNSLIVGSIVAKGGSGGNSGSSEMLVIKPTEIVTTSMNWSQVLEKAFDTVSLYGLIFSSSSITDLYQNGNWTLSNDDISISVTSDIVNVTVGNTSVNIYENGSWISDTAISSDTFKVLYTNDSGIINLMFYDFSDIPTNILLNNSTSNSIKNIGWAVAFYSSISYSETIDTFIKKANIKCGSITFNSTWSNNTVDGSQAIIGVPYENSITIDYNLGSCNTTITYSSANFYNDGWAETTNDLGNGCSWNKDTYTLTYPTGLILYPNTSSTSLYISDNIGFNVISGGDIILPNPQNYANQIAEIKDTVNGVNLMIYSTGTEWRFASDVLQLSENQYEKAPNTNSIYGISITGRYVLSPYNGMPIKLSSEGYWQTIEIQNPKYETTPSDYTILNSFSTLNYNVGDTNSTLTINIDPSIYLCDVFINVSDTVPTITWQEAWLMGSTIIFKQDGTSVSSLTFEQNKYYHITVNSGSFSDNKVIFINCETYNKPV